MAALAQGTVLVEGAVRSGALNTARWTNLPRPVLGLPGPVTSAASAGVHQLIRMGEASMVTNAQEILNDLTAHSAAASARSAQVDESYVPSPVRYAPAPLGADARRRRDRRLADSPKRALWINRSQSERPPPTLLAVPKEAPPMIDTTIDPPGPPAARIDWMADVSVERVLDDPPDLLGVVAFGEPGQ